LFRLLERIIGRKESAMAPSTYSTENPETEVPEELDATPARQGMRGVHILWVLIISFMLAAAVLFGSWAWRSGDLHRADPNNRAQPNEAQSFDTTAGQPGAVRQNESR
jgi:hypothetical protein